MDNTGNIYNIFNAIYFIKNTNKCDFITGGFSMNPAKFFFAFFIRFILTILNSLYKLD